LRMESAEAKEGADAVRPSPIRRRVFSRAVRDAGSSDSDECAICMQPFAPGAEVVTLSCPHVFHWSCLRPWLERSDTCPTCRIPLASARMLLSVPTTDQHSTALTQRRAITAMAPALAPLSEARYSQDVAGWGWAGDLPRQNATSSEEGRQLEALREVEALREAQEEEIAQLMQEGRNRVRSITATMTVRPASQARQDSWQHSAAQDRAQARHSQLSTPLRGRRRLRPNSVASTPEPRRLVLEDHIRQPHSVRAATATTAPNPATASEGFRNSSLRWRRNSAASASASSADAATALARPLGVKSAQTSWAKSPQTTLSKTPTRGKAGGRKKGPPQALPFTSFRQSRGEGRSIQLRGGGGSVMITRK